MLKKDKNGSPEWLSKLPQMAKQLEVSLYRNARSFDAYMDMSTLKQRLQQIAVEVSRKARNQGDQRDDRHRPADNRPTSQSQSSQGAYNPNNGMRPADPTSGSGGSPFMGMSSSSQHQQMAPNRGQVVTMDEINPMAGGGSSSGMPNMGGNMNSNMGAHGYPGSRQPSASSQQQQPQQQRPSSATAPPPSSSASTGQSQNRNDPEWKIRIRHKQQRLLLLHHSAKCPHEDGRCTVTPHCADMKRLWRHMEGCKDNNCRVSHCFSSRAILSHYRKCKDPACPACGPVRETVRKSQNRNPAGSNNRGGRNSSSSIGGIGGGGIPTSQMNNPMTSSLPQNNMMSDNSMGSSPLGGSFNAGSTSTQFPPQQPRQSSSTMPPPVSGPGGSQGMQQYSSMPKPSQQQQQQPYGSNSASTRPPSSSAQPSYRSDPQSSTGAPIGGTNDASSSSQRPPPASVPASSSNASSEAPRNDSEWQKVRHKQQRLLLLRHASRCQYEPSKCPVTPHCASMKKLWEHIAHCKNQQCTVPHCMSSRYVLSHYRRCKDARCPACGPVRETIRKSHEKERGDKPSSSNGQTSFDVDVARPPSDAAPGSLDPTPMGPIDSVSSPDRMQPTKRMKTEHDASGITSLSSMPQPYPPPLSQPGGHQVTSGVQSNSALAETTSAPIKDSKGPGDGSKTDSKGHEDGSLLNSFTVEQLTTHLASLNRASQLPPAKLKAKCTEVLKGLQSHQHGWVFNTPVDPVELGLPDYFEIIKKPMDLGSAQKKLESGQYHAIEDFQHDCNLTFDNAMNYNEKGSVVYDMAKDLKTKFDADYKKMTIQLDAEDEERRQNDRACTLCGCEKLLFEPPVFFCNGMNCQSKRIRRNSHFYIGGNNQYFWCNQCFNELDDKVPIELIDITINKPDLKKKKNDEVHEESWVQCDICERWIHQICGLFNTRQNKEHHSEYCCPKCLLEKRKTSVEPPPAKPPSAAELPRTKLSEYLENHVARQIIKKKRKLAEEQLKSDNTSMSDALRAYEEGGEVIIRQVTSCDRKLEVRDLMKKRYEYKKYPDEFPFRCKCIVVFQHIDGVDVVLFALYVYEHGADNPAPNQNCVYISYLDSVHFMKPRKMRTFVYHEILIAYLDYARERGFVTAHIWACPPLKGDDYIFYAKPEDQKTPRDSRLRQWYIDMLVECQNRAIVGTVTDMYDLYFADESLDATAVPYLEGDYFPGEAENIIKVLEEGGGKKKGGDGKKKKLKASKAKSRGGTRSTGLDEEALIASGMLDGVKDLSDLDRDQVMVKLGETIHPMKDSFIVAFLNWSGAKEEYKKVPESVMKYREEYPEEIVPLKSGNKRDASGQTPEEVGPVDKSGRPIKVIDDDAEDLDCEFLNNRQAFLNLCRGNHYQFDELRRAKHTSMMVLWHLHNRDAPKFVQQCVNCSREILSGKRYHCNTCADYDLCETCYTDPKVNRGACTHQLQAIAVEANQEEGGGSSGLTEAQRQQRQRNLLLHIQLIEHASRCNSSSCSSTNCAKMKNYLQHARMCRVSIPLD
jgi:E1A/CREB-binding protein